MSRQTPPRRHIARPASVVIRTVGDDAVAWNRASGAKLRLSPTYATLLASIPTRWTLAGDIIEPEPGAIERLVESGLVLDRRTEEGEPEEA